MEPNIQLIFCFTGLYCRNEYLSVGAPGPFVVHKEKGRKTYETKLTHNQRHGPTPPQERRVPDRFKAGFFKQNEVDPKKTNPLGLTLTTSSSGSMTQENFYFYAKHFISNLPSDQGKKKLPVVLFLDGHASRWNVAALRLLMNNNVYPFFLPSHTSIWSQPNDCGVNKRFHAAVEKAAKLVRRFQAEASITYFNRIFMKAWALFLDMESNDLFIGDNNTTTSYAKTGLYPFNPCADTWEEAINTLGLEQVLDDSVKKVGQWEIKIKTTEEGRSQLTEEEEKAICTGWVFEDNESDIPSPNRHVFCIAKMRGDGILAKWRKQREELLENNEFKKAEALKPEDVVSRNEGDIAAMKVITFMKATSQLPKPKELTDEEVTHQTTMHILNNTKTNGVVEILFFEKSNSDSDRESDKSISDNDSDSEGDTESNNDTNNENGSKTNNNTNCNDHKVDELCAFFNNAKPLTSGKSIERDSSSSASTSSSISTNKSTSVKGIAVKRDDGKWTLVLEDKRSSFEVLTEQLLNREQFYVSPIGRAMTTKERMHQAAKLKRIRRRQALKSQKEAKEKGKLMREEWLKTQHKDLINSLTSGSPWSYDRFRTFVSKIEKPFVVTVDGYRVAVGSDNEACFKAIAAEMVTGAISQAREPKVEVSEKENPKTSSLTVVTPPPNLKRKQVETRTENTKRGSDAISAEMRLTKRTKFEERGKNIKTQKELTSNIAMTEKCLTWFENKITAEENLSRRGISFGKPYWELDENESRDKLRNFLLLYHFPTGGGKLSANRKEQFEALQEFPLTKESLKSRIERAQKEVDAWKLEHTRLSCLVDGHDLSVQDSTVSVDQQNTTVDDSEDFLEEGLDNQ